MAHTPRPVLSELGVNQALCDKPDHYLCNFCCVCAGFNKKRHSGLFRFPALVYEVDGDL